MKEIIGMDRLLSEITLYTTFVCLGLSLWFAIYLLSRSRTNPLAFRAIVALVALAFYYTYLVNALVTGTNEKSPVRLFAITIALIAWHDLTMTMLSPEQRRKRDTLARGIILFGVIIIVVIFTAPPAPPCDPTIICPTVMNVPNLVVEVFDGLIFCSILSNLWSIRKTEVKLHNMVFFFAILVGVGSVTFSFVGTVLNVAVPRLLPNLLILSAVLLMAYSVARDRTFVTHRMSTYDLPVTLLTITVIVGIYILAGRELRLSGTNLVLITVLAIFTHSAYDFVRDFLEQLFHRQQRQIRRELDTLGREATTDESLQRYLSRGLAILCKNLNASRGFLAIRRDELYTIVASFHSLPVSTVLPSNEVALEGCSQPSGAQFSQIAWLAPGYAGSEQVALIGIGPRRDKSPYNQDDLFWLEDIAQEIGKIVHLNFPPRPARSQDVPVQSDASELESSQPIDQGGLLSALAYKPDQELVACIEDGYQHLNDYDALGKSPLVELFGIQAVDHLEGGKLVRQKLIQMLDKLRPAGPPPAEPLPRAWYAYTILHDSYVDDCLSRDIMGKLYIGEGTYYRLRRQALRGITRAVLEMGAS
jgi:hypothetical protein